MTLAFGRALKACLDAKQRYYAKQPKSAPLPWDELKAAEVIIFNDIHKALPEYRTVKVLEVPEDIQAKLVTAYESKAAKQAQADDMSTDIDWSDDTPLLPEDFKQQMRDSAPWKKNGPRREYPVISIGEHEHNQRAAELGIDPDALNEMYADGSIKDLYRINRIVGNPGDTTN